MTKKIIFYGKDGDAAKKIVSDRKGPEADTFQVIQADAYQGERLEADEYEFAEDVPEGERRRISDLWGKFDNRQSFDPSAPGRDTAANKDDGSRTGLVGQPLTAGADRRNLNPQTRVTDPRDVKTDETEHSAFTPDNKRTTPGQASQPQLQDRPTFMEHPNEAEKTKAKDFAKQQQSAGKSESRSTK